MKGLKGQATADRGLTDAEVEIEIDRLQHSEAVRLAKAEQQMIYRRRQYMYSLRCMEKRGKALMAEGKTIRDFRDVDDDCESC